MPVGVSGLMSAVIYRWCEWGLTWPRVCGPPPNDGVQVYPVKATGNSPLYIDIVGNCALWSL